jgi:hypothetical protein
MYNVRGQRVRALLDGGRDLETGDKSIVQTASLPSGSTIDSMLNDIKYRKVRSIVPFFILQMYFDLQ